jgi:hypothetical protein
MLHYLLPRLRDFVFVLVLIGGLVTGARMLNTDSDLGRNLALGNYILSSHQIPTTDLLSFTKAGQSRPPYEWLADILFALAYRLLGLDGVVLLTSLVLAVTFTCVYLDAVQRSAAPILTLFMGIWAAVASSLHWLSRPHVFSFLFFALWLAMLERVRRGQQQPLWLFPLLMLIWANAHGGFIFGFLAYLAYLVGWAWDSLRKSGDRRVGRSLAWIGGTSLVASFMTPDLWGNWLATLNNRSTFVLSQTVETMPLNLASLNAWPFVGLLALSVLLIPLRWKEFVPAHVLLLAGLALAGVVFARNAPFFAIAAAPICAALLARSFSFSPLAIWLKLEDGFAAIDRSMRGWLWSGLAVVVAVGVLFYRQQETKTTVFHLNPSTFPVAAVSWLDQHPQQGHMFNDINWGGYLIFSLWPRERVFIDSQTDFYGESLLRQYVGILEAAPGWDTDLQQYNIRWLLIPPSVPLAAIAARAQGWQVAYQDETAVVLVRR